jgi:hypothetical protein
MWSIPQLHSLEGGRTAVRKFIANYQDQISGVLSGFDRLVLRGTLRSIAHAGGMNQYLSTNHVLLKDFGTHVEQVSSRLKAASLAEAVATGRPVRYLASAKASKENIARGIAVDDDIRQGLVCVLTSVEPCRTFEIYRNRETKHLHLEPRIRKCLFLYHYVVHPVFGFLNAPHSDLVPLFDSDLLERQGVAGSADGSGGPGLCAARQLLSLDRGLASRTRADGSATQR